MKISNFPTKDKRYFIWLAACLLCISSFLHFWKLGDVPNGFYADEASVGYNAWCIAETGADEYGVRFPVFFKCFDNFQDPVYVYFLVPLIKVFGPEKWVVRFPAAFFCILASVAVYFLSSKYCRNRWICLCSAFVFSVLPWIFALSRSGMGGYMPMLLGMVSGWYFLLMAIGRKSIVYGILSGIAWAFTMYAHQIGRPMGALLLVFFVLSFNVLLLKRWKAFLCFAGIFVISMLPMIFYVCAHPESMTKRFSQHLCVWNGSSGIYETATRIAERYFEYFSHGFLFISGDPILRHHSGASGQLFIFLIPFLIAGLLVSIKSFFLKPHLRFLILVLLAYPAAAMITIDHMHSTRSLNGSIPWLLTAVVGAGFLWRKRAIKWARLVISVSICLSLCEISIYLNDYFGKYPSRSRSDFGAPIIEAFEYSFKRLGSDGTLYISSSSIPQKVNVEFKPFWYSKLLFFGRIFPGTYQDNGLPKERISAYEGQAINHGILIRSNLLRFKALDGNVYSMLNGEAVPGNALLIKEIPVVEGGMAMIEIYYIDSNVKFQEDQDD